MKLVTKVLIFVLIIILFYIVLYLTLKKEVEIYACHFNSFLVVLKFVSLKLIQMITLMLIFFILYYL